MIDLSRSVPYVYEFACVRLPGRRRYHYVAGVVGNPMPVRTDLSTPPPIDWPEVKATLLERDRWLVWRAETTVCGQAGWVSGAGVDERPRPICKICLREARRACLAAPPEARALVGWEP